MQPFPSRDSQRKPCARPLNSALRTLEAPGGGMPPPGEPPLSHKTAPTFLHQTPKPRVPATKPCDWEDLQISGCPEHKSRASQHEEPQEPLPTMIIKPSLSTRGAAAPFRRVRLNSWPSQSPGNWLQSRIFHPPLAILLRRQTAGCDHRFSCFSYKFSTPTSWNTERAHRKYIQHPYPKAQPLQVLPWRLTRTAPRSMQSGGFTRLFPVNLP